MAEHDETRLFGIGLTIGVALGLAIGLLYAPKPGREIRADLKEKAITVEHKAEHILAEAREKAKTIIEEAKTKVAARKATDTSD